MGEARPAAAGVLCVPVTVAEVGRADDALRGPLPVSRVPAVLSDAIKGV